MYGEGVSKEGSIVDIGAEMDIVQKSGAWFSYSGDRLGQGRENAKQFLKDNPSVRDAIEKKIRENSNLITTIPPVSNEEEEEDDLEDFEDAE
jgi:recombination protein RecA